MKLFKFITFLISTLCAFFAIDVVASMEMQDISIHAFFKETIDLKKFQPLNALDKKQKKLQLARINDKSNGRPALINCCALGFDDLVKKLLEAGADPNIKDSKGTGVTPLMAAAIGGFDKVIDLLCACRAIDVDAKDDQGYTALMHAAFNGHLATTQKLHNLGAKVNSITLNGETILDKAVTTYNPQLVEFLLSQGARVTYTFNNKPHSVIETAKSIHKMRNSILPHIVTKFTPEHLEKTHRTILELLNLYAAKNEKKAKELEMLEQDKQKKIQRIKNDKAAKNERRITQEQAYMHAKIAEEEELLAQEAAKKRELDKQHESGQRELLAQQQKDERAAEQKLKDERAQQKAFKDAQKLAQSVAFQTEKKRKKQEKDAQKQNKAKAPTSKKTPVKQQKVQTQTPKITKAQAKMIADKKAREELLALEIRLNNSAKKNANKTQPIADKAAHGVSNSAVSQQADLKLNVEQAQTIASAPTDLRAQLDKEDAALNKDMEKLLSNLTNEFNNE